MAQKPFHDSFTPLQREVINHLAEIEKEDADRCANCGGEDCVCCEYYLDRQKWVEPYDLFAEDDSLYRFDFYDDDDDDEEFEESDDE